MGKVASVTYISSLLHPLLVLLLCSVGEASETNTLARREALLNQQPKLISRQAVQEVEGEASVSQNVLVSRADVTDNEALDIASFDEEAMYAFDEEFGLLDDNHPQDISENGRFFNFFSQSFSVGTSCGRAKASACDYSSLAEALYGAPEGATLLLQGETFETTTGFLLNGKGVTIKSVSARNPAVILITSSTGSGFVLSGNFGSSYFNSRVVLISLTIRSNFAIAGILLGTDVVLRYLTVRQCKILNLQNGFLAGFGPNTNPFQLATEPDPFSVFTAEVGKIAIVDCTFTDNMRDIVLTGFLNSGLYLKRVMCSNSLDFIPNDSPSINIANATLALALVGDIGGLVNAFDAVQQSGGPLGNVILYKVEISGPGYSSAIEISSYENYAGLRSYGTKVLATNPSMVSSFGINVIGNDTRSVVLRQYGIDTSQSSGVVSVGACRTIGFPKSLSAANFVSAKYFSAPTQCTPNPLKIDIPRQSSAGIIGGGLGRNVIYGSEGPDLINPLPIIKQYCESPTPSNNYIDGRGGQGETFPEFWSDVKKVFPGNTVVYYIPFATAGTPCEFSPDSPNIFNLSLYYLVEDCKQYFNYFPFNIKDQVKNIDNFAVCRLNSAGSIGIGEGTLDTWALTEDGGTCEIYTLPPLPPSC